MTRRKTKDEEEHVKIKSRFGAEVITDTGLQH